MSLTRTCNSEREYYFDYQLSGIRDCLIALVNEEDLAIRTKLSEELLEFMYPTKTAKVIVRVKDPVKEIWNHTK